jgi:hypothetical protein
MGIIREEGKASDSLFEGWLPKKRKFRWDPFVMKEEGRRPLWFLPVEIQDFDSFWLKLRMITERSDWAFDSWSGGGVLQSQLMLTNKNFQEGW